MKADERSASPAMPGTTPLGLPAGMPAHATPHSTPPDEPNALGEFVNRVRSGDLLTSRGYRILGLSVLVALVAAVGWYFLREGRRATSRQWAELARPGSVDLERFAEQNKSNVLGHVARLEMARALAGPQGQELLPSDKRETRAKGIENLAKARDEFDRLSGEFKNDKTLRATCLVEAAEAELGLVGIPTGPNKHDSRGDLKAVARFYTRAATVAGSETPIGEKYLARAKEFADNEEKLLAEAKELNSPYTLADNYIPPTPPTVDDLVGPYSPEKLGLAPPNPTTPIPPIVLPGTTPGTARTPTTQK